MRARHSAPELYHTSRGARLQRTDLAAKYPREIPMPNLNLTCIDCGNDFYFKEKDQLFYAKQGYDAPKRCWDCRKIRKEEKQNKAISAIKKA